MMMCFPQGLSTSLNNAVLNILFMRTHDEIDNILKQDAVFIGSDCIDSYSDTQSAH